MCIKQGDGNQIIYITLSEVKDIIINISIIIILIEAIHLLCKVIGLQDVDLFF